MVAGRWTHRSASASAYQSRKLVVGKFDRLRVCGCDEFAGCDANVESIAPRIDAESLVFRAFKPPHEFFLLVTSEQCVGDTADLVGWCDDSDSETGVAGFVDLELFDYSFSQIHIFFLPGRRTNWLE